MALLEAEDLAVAIGRLSPLDGVSFRVGKGEVLGIVGESGSGKSLTALTVMGLLGLVGGRVTRGAIRFDGTDLVGLDEAAYRRLRGRRIALITQNPMTSLDPLQRVGAQIDQVARLHLGLGPAASRTRIIEIL